MKSRLVVALGAGALSTLAALVGDVHAQAAEAGRAEYEAHCLACHGPTGRGDGPESRNLKLPVPDLALVARRNGGEFPLERVRRSIDGRDAIKGHAGRTMPIWGLRFARGQGEPDAVVAQRLDALAEYLRGLQVR
jgi:mono/diheme cytochrome c family protein